MASQGIVVMLSSLPAGPQSGSARTIRFAMIPTVAALLAFTLGGFAQEPTSKPPVQVKIQDETPVAADVVMPIDPQQHVQLNNQGNMLVNIRVDNQNMHLGYIQTVFHIDGQVMYAGNPP